MWFVMGDSFLKPLMLSTYVLSWVTFWLILNDAFKISGICVALLNSLDLDDGSASDPLGQEKQKHCPSLVIRKKYCNFIAKSDPDILGLVISFGFL